MLLRPVAIVNDADAAGIAEMRFGIGKDRPGTVIFLTLGTGVGSGVFNDGVLVPNTEFGQMEIRGRPAERRSAADRADAARPVVEGLGAGPRRAPPGHRHAALAEPPDPRRRRQQERRPVHPAAHGPAAGRGRHPAQRRGDHRGRDRRGRAGRDRRPARRGRSRCRHPARQRARDRDQLDTDPEVATTPSRPARRGNGTDPRTTTALHDHRHQLARSRQVTIQPPATPSPPTPRRPRAW